MTEQEFETTYNSLIRLMYKLLYKFQLQNDEDAESHARIALFKAIKTFDSSLNLKISNYAYECIYNALCAYIKIRKKDIPSYKLVEYEGTIHYDDKDEQVERGFTVDYQEYTESQLAVEGFINILSEREKFVVNELLAGTNRGDIPKKLGVSREWYRRVLNKIRYKYNEFNK